MVRTAWFILLGAALMAQTPQAAPSAPRPMPGAPNSLSLDAPVVAEARAFIQRNLPLLRIERVLEASTQVVAGTKMSLVCRVQEEEGPGTWAFTIYRRPNRRWRLQSAQRTGD